MDMRNRPLSPHLQIYRFQLTSVLSMAHRISGIVLCFGAVVLVFWLVTVASGADAYEHFQGWMGSLIGRSALFGWTLALFYHLCNGIRHLAWDLGYGFELPTVYRTGWTVVACAITLTLLAWIVGYASRGS